MDEVKAAQAQAVADRMREVFSALISLDDDEYDDEVYLTEED